MSTRSQLAKKFLCTCPICQQKIYGGMLDLNAIDITKVKHFPFSYTYIHSHESVSEQESSFNQHAIMLYFDAEFAVRGVEECSFFKVV